MNASPVATAPTGAGDPASEVVPMRAAPVNPLIGAEVTGVDLAGPVGPERAAELRRLLAEHKVLFFRDQEIDADAHLALGSSLGSVVTFPGVSAELPDHRGVQIIGSWRPATRPDGGRATGGWHIDASGLVRAPILSILRAVHLPPIGGDTVWANLAAAYAGLPDALRETVDDLHVTHDVATHFRERGIEYPLIAHRLARRHPETGETVLFVNFSLRPQIVGWDAARSAELLGVLREEATRPEYQVRLRWAPGTVAIWDNRAVHHYAVRDYGEFPRRLERVLVTENQPPYVEEIV